MLILLGLCTSLSVSAQQLDSVGKPSVPEVNPRIWIKAGAQGINNLLVGIEKPVKGKSSLLFRAQYSWDNIGSYNLYHGDLIYYFEEGSLEVRQSSYPFTVYLSEKTKLDKPPLPHIPEKIQVSSLSLDLGWSTFCTLKRNYFVTLEPSLLFRRYQFYDINQYYHKISEERTVTNFADSGGFLKQYIVSNRYKQVREMRQRQLWSPSVSYQFGIGKQIGKRIRVEGRLGAILTLPVHNKNGTSPPVKSLESRYSLLVGIGI